MLSNRISHRLLPAIGQRLLEKGKCEHDPNCTHGYSRKCTCPDNKLQQKLDPIRQEYLQEPHCVAAWPNTVDPTPWPCDSWIVIYFDKPEFEDMEESTDERPNRIYG